MNNIEALLSALKYSQKNITIIAGSAISYHPLDSRAVPGISGMLDVAHEYLNSIAPELSLALTECIKEKSGQDVYQELMNFIQSHLSQDAVNAVITNAVLKATNQVNPRELPGDIDINPLHWVIPPAIQHLSKSILNGKVKFSDKILTTNFDPLIAIGLISNGILANRISIHSDGSLPKIITPNTSTKSIIHLHGYWRDSDTLHTPQQIGANRPQLKASIQNLLRNSTLLVVAYGGWDDVLRRALNELVNDDAVNVDVIWCFYEDSQIKVSEKYGDLFKSFSAATIRGRFRPYYNINCIDLFERLADISKTTEIQRSQAPCTEISTPINSSQNKLLTASRTMINLLKKRLSTALKVYNFQPNIWVEPHLSNVPEISSERDGVIKYDIADIIKTPRNLTISAPAEFGLTSLSHYLTLKAYEDYGDVWVRIDLDEISPTAFEITTHISEEIQLFGCSSSDIKCIILDSWKSNNKSSHKVLLKLKEKYPLIPIVITQTIDGSQLIQNTEISEALKSFEKIFLWALTRHQIRSVVSAYNDGRQIGDEEGVIKKVVSDLETLNLHRTPLNCITLLRVSEIDFDENPVNRTEVIKRMLFLVFNSEEIPTYKSKPDLKDCEYILGCFCEQLIRANEYLFSRDRIMTSIRKICQDQLIHTDVSLLFDILAENSIIVSRGSLFSFKFAYWLYYFAAQRMHHSSEFAKYVLSDLVYTKFPEIIEFYTGIDRRRSDAMDVLIHDIDCAFKSVSDLCKLPQDFNPLNIIEWRPRESQIELMRNEISKGVEQSNLPAEIKDAYADSCYDCSKPYNQDVRKFLSQSSLVNMMIAMKAGARALRNSDYVDPEKKKIMLEKILQCWSQLAKVIFVILPLLAENGIAEFDGMGFYLNGDFGDDFDQKIRTIISVIPSNIIKWACDDIYSQKMTPLFGYHINNAENPLEKHHLALLLIKCRPDGWSEIVRPYVASLPKNSFYLMNIYHKLRWEYQYGFASEKSLRAMSELIKVCGLKHFSGIANPSKSDIKKLKSESIIPERSELSDI